MILVSFVVSFAGTLITIPEESRNPQFGEGNLEPKACRLQSECDPFCCGVAEESMHGEPAPVLSSPKPASLHPSSLLVSGQQTAVEKRRLPPSSRPSLRPSIPPSVRPSVHLSIHLSIHPSVRPSVPPSLPPSLPPSRRLGEPALISGEPQSSLRRKSTQRQQKGRSNGSRGRFRGGGTRTLKQFTSLHFFSLQVHPFFF